MPDSPAHSQTTRRRSRLAFLLKMMQPPPLSGLPLSCRLGAWLLITNIPLGYLCLLCGTVTASVTENPRWLVIGSLGYALSWLMLGFGILLTGTGFYKKMKNRIKRRRQAWKRLNGQPSRAS